MKKFIYPLFIGLLCLGSCDNAQMMDDGEPPVLGTVVVDEVTMDAIVCHVEVTEGEVTDCGFYYGTSKVNVANGKADKAIGSYSESIIHGEIKGLAPNKEYYIMAYGVNDAGTGETELVKVKTLSRTPSVDDNKYPNTQP